MMMMREYDAVRKGEPVVSLFRTAIIMSMFSGRPVSDMDLQALVDDQCDPKTRRAVMQAVMESPVLMARLEDLLKQKKQLQSYWDDYRRLCEH